MKHPRASTWFRASSLASRNLEPEVATWIHDQGSLTKRLVDRCGDAFSVRVLSQQWVKPRFEESQLLGSPPQQKALLRQVQLLCNDQVLVYARSVIPLETLQGPHCRLKFLGDKPLGGYLFANPTLRREQQELATIQRKDPLFSIALSDAPPECERIWGRRSLFRIDGKDPLFSIALSDAPPECERIWGRRSLFRIDGKALLVTEFFLPELIQE